MELVGAVTLLVLGAVAVVVATAAISQGWIWCVPRTGFAQRGRWVHRSTEGWRFWSNTLTIGGLGVAGLVVACRTLIRAG